METNYKAHMLQANTISNTSIIRLLLASLMANGLDVNGVHKTMQKYKDEVRSTKESLPEILKVPFYHTCFILVLHN